MRGRGGGQGPPGEARARVGHRGASEAELERAEPASGDVSRGGG